MRSQSKIPAQQLASVSLRYCQRLDYASTSRSLADTRLIDVSSQFAARANVAPTATNHKSKKTKESSNYLHDDKSRLEAVLFIAKEPLHTRKLAQYADLADGTQARTLARQLNQIYDRSGRAFRIEEVAGGLQLRTRKPFAPWLRRLGHVPAELRLSAPAMETLAVVAYQQPVMRASIEAIRGVGCGEILRQLLERDLVRVAGRSEELGRPYVYGTTKRFLESFGLRNLDQLPRAETFQKNVDEPEEKNGDGVQQGESEVSVTIDKPRKRKRRKGKPTHPSGNKSSDTLRAEDDFDDDLEDDEEWDDESDDAADEDDDWEDGDADDDALTDDEEEWEEVGDDEEEDDDYEYEYESDDDDEEVEGDDADEDDDEWEEVDDEEVEDDDEYEYVYDDDDEEVEDDDADGEDDVDTAADDLEDDELADDEEWDDSDDDAADDEWEEADDEEEGDWD